MTDSAENMRLAVDSYNRYPGELATFYLQVTVPEQKNPTLQFSIPKVMQIESLELPDGIPPSTFEVVVNPDDLLVLIHLKDPFKTGQTYDIKVRVRIHTQYFDHHFLAEAMLVENRDTVLESQTVQVTVYGKGKYLTYLPEVYEGDDFTSRFLMLIESFWKPINQQTDQLYTYFDLGITPQEFLPWLSSWIGMPIDPSLPEDRKRALLKQAIMFFQYRGTFHATKKYLEIYTGGQVKILEQRAKNFILGDENALGVDVALGTANRPNTLLIEITVARSELVRSGLSENMYNKKINEIIRTIIPVQASFEMNCSFEMEVV